ncbi:MAG TPA: sigma-54 dependent transcriptional regulator [Cryomorphaceae bacterium]|nr:sigma-54 dependent transcriptional regulator [Cryomorphaceae bacterium]
MNVLIVDDDPAFNKMLGSYLERKNYEVHSAHSADSAIKVLEKNHIDLVLTDFKLPGTDGLELITIIKKKAPGLPVILITNYSDIRTAVDSIKLGAFEFVTKPIIPEELLATMDMALKQKTKPRDQNGKQEETHATEGKDGFIKGTTEEAQQLWEHVSVVAPTHLSVLILGESGTGKENVARVIHSKSNRADKPFIALDCGALSKDLAASELFGHKKGAFTGALSDKKGQFELANGGTIFLDEVGNLPYDVQVKLLRALQERKIRAVGSDQETSIDVRLISATNDDLMKYMEADNFRTDLYHRLNEFEIQLPPLRNRMDDLQLFCDYFIRMAADELGKSLKLLTDDVKDIFRNYDWPGNLRELRNILRRAVLLSTGDEITTVHLPAGFGQRTSPEPEHSNANLNLREAGMTREKVLIQRALKENKYNKSATAKALNIDRSTLYRKLKDYGIDA